MASPKRKGVQVYEGDAQHIVGITRLENLAIYVKSARLTNVAIAERKTFGLDAKRIRIEVHADSWKGVTKASVEKLIAIEKPLRIGTFVLHKAGFLDSDKKTKPMKVKAMQITAVECDLDKPLELAVIFDQHEEISGDLTL